MIILHGRDGTKNPIRRAATAPDLSPRAAVSIDAANPGTGRPTRTISTDTVRRQVNHSDWRRLLSDSRALYLNFGPVKGAVVDKAIYSVGRAWQPVFAGKDKAWGEEATEWLRHQWYGTADIAGGMHDLVTDLLLISIAIDRDGDCGILLTGSGDYPQIQLIGAERIQGTQAKIASGPYAGLTLDKGVVYGPTGRPVGYRILSDPPSSQGVPEERWVSARDMIHAYDPEWFAQGRGLPAFTHALLDLHDLQMTQGFEKRAALIASSIGLIEHNDSGQPDPSDPAFALRTDTEGNATGVVVETLEGGTIRYLRSNSGAKLEALTSNRPTQNWDAFMNRLLRNALVGVGWPYELTWTAEQIGGANIRMVIGKAMRTVEDRQDLLRGIFRRVIGYGVAKAIKGGMLAASDDWYRWDFTLPERMTVDYGREAQQDREDYIIGAKTLQDLIGPRASVEEHLRVRAREEQLILAIADEFGIDPERLRSLARPVAAQASTEEPEP